MSSCSITLGCVGSVRAPNPSALSSLEVSEACPVSAHHLLVWAGRLSAPCHAQAGVGAVAKGDPTSSTQLCAAPWDASLHGWAPHSQLHICPFFWPFHHPRHAIPTKPGNSLSFNFPRVERTRPIFIAANQASRALAALRKIAEAFLSLELFIIHQIGFQLPPSILCVVFPKIWILVYDEVSLKDLKEGHRKAKQEKGKQDDKNRHSVKRTKLSVNKIYLCRNQQRPEHEQKWQCTFFY